MKISAILCLSLALCFRQVSSAIQACSAPSDCTTNEPNSDICTGVACVCNINYEIVTDDCALISCSTAIDDCGTNTACTAGDECSCIANYVEKEAACIQLVCSSDSDCTTPDTNSYCEGSNCACKNNFDGATSADCTRKVCAVNKDCKDVANSYCIETDTNAGCTCGIYTTADTTTGACASSTTCTLANAVTTCGANAHCIATDNTYQCQCAATYLPGATVCVQRDCAIDGDCTGADSNSICDTTNSLCVCADTFAASGNKCKKVCTGDGTGTCDTAATCTGGVCECNVNYDGNGADCTQLTCTGSDVTTCHPNSQCSTPNCACASTHVASGTMCKIACTGTGTGVCGNDATCSATTGACECNVNYVGDGVTCTQLACTDSSTCSSYDANAICVSSLCQCKQNYVGSGSSCSTKACTTATVTADCGANTNCTSDICACATGYEISSIAVECVQSNTTTTTTTTVATTTSGAEQFVTYNVLLFFSGLICFITKMF